MRPLILDGARLARERIPDLSRRAERVRERRGTAPRLLLVAFENETGRAPWVSGKLRACEEAGVDVRSLVLAEGTATAEALRRLDGAAVRAQADGVFVQFPFPPGIDGDALSAAIPADADIDVMNPANVEDYLAGRGDDPPLTVAAVVALLTGRGIDLTGGTGRIVGEQTPFNAMLAEALARQGAPTTRVAPGTPAMAELLEGSTVVVTMAARPGVLRSSDVPAGAILVDGGYFNRGGRGDVDPTPGIDHLRAWAPVPGGVGPMTVSALLEAVIGRAEGR